MTNRAQSRVCTSFAEVRKRKAIANYQEMYLRWSQYSDKGYYEK